MGASQTSRILIPLSAAMVANFFIHPRPVGSMQIPAPVRAREETTSTYQNTFRDTDALARSYDPEASMQDSDEDLDPKSEKHNVSSMNFAELKLAVLRIKVQRQYSTRTRPLCAMSRTTETTGETREPSRPELNSLDFGMKSALDRIQR